MRRRPAASALRRRFNAMAIVAAIAVFSVLAGTGASYAYWSANASRTVNSTTGNVQVTVSGLTAGQIHNHVKQTVGFVTVTNTTVQNASSTTPATLSLTVGASGGNAFATAAGVVVWPAAGNSSAN
jgi:predicted ribosomally synthesized peptide with SipW-like signal peptide